MAMGVHPEDTRLHSFPFPLAVGETPATTDTHTCLPAATRAAYAPRAPQYLSAATIVLAPLRSASLAITPGSTHTT